MFIRTCILYLNAEKCWNSQYFSGVRTWNVFLCFAVVCFFFPPPSLYLYLSISLSLSLSFSLGLWLGGGRLGRGCLYARRSSPSRAALTPPPNTPIPLLAADCFSPFLFFSWRGGVGSETVFCHQCPTRKGPRGDF